MQESKLLNTTNDRRIESAAAEPAHIVDGVPQECRVHGELKCGAFRTGDRAAVAVARVFLEFRESRDPGIVSAGFDEVIQQRVEYELKEDSNLIVVFEPLARARCVSVHHMLFIATLRRLRPTQNPASIIRGR